MKTYMQHMRTILLRRMDVDRCAHACAAGPHDIREPPRTPPPRPHSASACTTRARQGAPPRPHSACTTRARQASPHIINPQRIPHTKPPGRGRAGNDTIRGLREIRRAPQCSCVRWGVDSSVNAFLCQCDVLGACPQNMHACIHICMHACCVYGVVCMLTRPLAPVHYTTDDDCDPVPCRIPNSARFPGAQRPVHVAHTARLDLTRRSALLCAISVPADR